MAQVYVTADGGRFVTISLRLPVELKDDLDALAHLARSDVSSIVIALIEALIDANRERIDEFRKMAAIPIKMPAFLEADEGEDEAEK